MRNLGAEEYLGEADVQHEPIGWLRHPVRAPYLGNRLAGRGAPARQPRWERAAGPGLVGAHQAMPRFNKPQLFFDCLEIERTRTVLAPFAIYI